MASMLGFEPWPHWWEAERSHYCVIPLMFPKTLKLIAFLVFARKTASFIAQISSFENVLKQTPSWLWTQNSE